MTVPAQLPFISHTASGSTATFAFDFLVILKTDLRVTVGGSAIAQGDFSITGLGEDNGGTITLSAGNPVAGTVVILQRSVPLSREIDYQQSGEFRAVTVNADFDRIWQALQDGRIDVRGAIRYPASENKDGTLAGPGSRANMLLGFDQNGNQIFYPVTASVGAGDMRLDTFTAGVDFTAGVTTQLTLSRPPGGSANLEIFFDPLFQGPDQWTVVGSIVTFTAPIPVGVSKVFARIGTTLSTLTPPPGSVSASDVSYLAPYTGAIPQTLQVRATDWISAFDFMSTAQIADVRARTELVDVTGALQAAAATGKPFWLPPGGYRISGEIVLNTNQSVFIAGARVRQYTANTPIFRATQKDNVWVVGHGGAVLYGEGAWSALWTGNGGHDDMGVKLIGCTRSGIKGIQFKNFAASAIMLHGGSRLRVMDCQIEGTHTYSTALPFGANFQNGIYLRDDATYGECDDITLSGIDISGTAQGVLRENYGTTISNLGMSFSNLNIHDIPGQHGFYLQTGSVSISGVTLTNVAGSGIKFQSADANQAINGCSAVGVTGRVLGVSLFEINCTGSGSTNNVHLQGVADQAVVGLATSGQVRDLRAHLELTNTTSNAVLIQGANPKDFDIEVVAQTCGDDGILISATGATGLRFHRPRLRECNNNNTAAAGISGIRVASASANVEIFDPEVTDVNARQQYGLFNSVAGSVVKVRGSATFTGASDTAVRATGLITEWPTEVTLSGANGDYTSPANVKSSQAMVMTGSTNSASNSVLWARDLIAGQTYKVVAELSYMRGDNSDRRSARSTVLVYVNAGVAVIEGSPIETEAIFSGGVAGVYSWAVSGSQIQLLINSGAATTYRWKARVSVTQSGL